MPIPIIEKRTFEQTPIIKRDLSVFAKGMETLTARHQAAIQQQGAIENKLSQVELNEAEDEWKFNYGNEIRNKIDSEAQLGNYAGALTTAVREAGKATSNPAFMGRVRANAEYNQYQNELSQRNDINENIKEYFRETNPYTYEDKVNDKGDIVGGTSWKPTRKPVSTVDTYKLMQTARVNAARDAGGSNTIYYMDANGEFTSDINKSTDGMPYISKGNKYEALSKDKLRKGIEAAIAATPGAAESIQQDYEAGIWKTKKDQTASNNTDTSITSEVTDDKGMFLTKDQYLEKMVDPFIKSATYSHNFSDTTALAGLSTGAARLRAKGEEGGAVNTAQLGKTAAGYYEAKTASASAVFAQKGAARQGLSQIATSMGVIVKPTATGDSIFNAIKTMAQKKGTIIPKEAIDVYDAYQESNRKFDNMVPANVSTDQRQALEFTSALDNGVDLAQLGDNTYAKDYIKNINKIFGDSSEKIYFKLPLGSTNVKNIIEQLDNGHPGSHRDLGVTVDRDGGGSYIVLDRKHATNFYLVNKAMNEFKDSKDFRSAIGDKHGYDTILRDNGNGGKERTSSPQTNTRAAYISYDVANKKLEAFTASHGESSPVNVPQTSIGVNDITYQYGTNLGLKPAEMTTLQKTIDNNIDTYQAQMGELYIGGIGEVRKGVETGQERAELYASTMAIKAKYPNRVIVSIDDKTLGTIITVLADKSDKPNTEKLTKNGDSKLSSEQGYTMYIPNLIDSNVKKMILNSPSIKAKSELYNNVLSGGGLTPLGENESLHSNDGNNYTYNSEYGNIQVSEEQASQLLQNKKYISDLRYSVYSSGGLDNLSDNNKQVIVNNVVNNYKSIFGLSNVEYKDLPNDVINLIQKGLQEINKSY